MIQSVDLRDRIWIESGRVHTAVSIQDKLQNCFRVVRSLRRSLEVIEIPAYQIQIWQQIIFHAGIVDFVFFTDNKIDNAIIQP
jgi:hypothetical protein